MRASRSFTLIEILVAMTIVIILTALLVMGLGGTKTKAMHKASVAMVNKIKVALDNYYAAFRDYPPDGYDLGEKGTGSGWDVTRPQGVRVGYIGNRRVRGTASLIYFLCRPVIKTTNLSSDPGTIGDPKFTSYTKVGPFLQLEPGDFTLQKLTVNSEEINFNPNYPWTSNEFWETQGGLNCEIIDAFGRPLCYDKVKTEHLVQNPSGNQYQFFQPDLFQNPATGTGNGGIFAVHPDANRYIVEGQMPINIDDEPDIGLDEADLIYYRCDPRYSKATGTNLVNSLESGTPPTAGTGSGADPTTWSHRPKNVPGYDLWSAGKSWVDPRDDITSWGD